MHLLFQYLVFHHTTDPLYEKLLKLIKYLFVLQPSLLLLRYFPHQLIKFWTHGKFAPLCFLKARPRLHEVEPRSKHISHALFQQMALILRFCCTIFTLLRSPDGIIEHSFHRLNAYIHIYYFMSYNLVIPKRVSKGLPLNEIFTGFLIKTFRYTKN